MIQKTKYLLILFISVLYSCKTLQKKDILGTYQYNSPISVGKLTLNDTTFEYTYEIPLASYESKGTWSLQQNGLIFQSYDAYNNDYMIVKELSNKESYIQILDQYDNPIRWVRVSINDEFLKETDLSGKINIDTYKKGEIVKIKLEYLYLDIDKSTYYIKSKDSNVFIIKVIPQDPGKKFFDGEVIKIKNKKITIDNHKHVKIRG